MTDALSDALRSLQLSAGMFPHSELTVPWRLDVDALPCVVFHLLTHGRAHIELPGLDPVHLSRGDLVVLPHGEPHRLVDGDDASPVSLVRALQERDPWDDGPFRPGQGPVDVRLACGFFELDPTGAELVLSSLPRLIHVPADTEHQVGWMSSALEAIGRETEDSSPGSAALLDQLAGVLFIQVLRAHLETLPDDQEGWLMGLRDPRIAAAMTRIHRTPEVAWTIDTLAAAAGMSRSAFTARFRELLGMSPGQYLARWRMHRAAVFLRRDRIGVGEAARRVGYESEATFAKAFKRHVGLPPGVYREQAPPSFGASLGRRSA